MVSVPDVAIVSAAPARTSTDLARAAVPAPITGWKPVVAVVETITTSSVAVGTRLVLQLAGVFQSVLLLPSQMKEPVGLVVVIVALVVLEQPLVVPVTE